MFFSFVSIWPSCNLKCAPVLCHSIDIFMIAVDLTGKNTRQLVKRIEFICKPEVAWDSLFRSLNRATHYLEPQFLREGIRFI